MSSSSIKSQNKIKREKYIKIVKNTTVDNNANKEYLLLLLNNIDFVIRYVRIRFGKQIEFSTNIEGDIKNIIKNIDTDKFDHYINVIFDRYTKYKGEYVTRALRFKLMMKII